LSTAVNWSVRLSVWSAVRGDVEISVHAAPLGKRLAKIVATAHNERASEWSEIEITVPKSELSEFHPHAAVQGWLQVRASSGPIWIDAIEVRTADAR
jgi:hypothetical protein